MVPSRSRSMSPPFVWVRSTRAVPLSMTMLASRSPRTVRGSVRPWTVALASARPLMDSVIVPVVVSVGTRVGRSVLPETRPRSSTPNASFKGSERRSRSAISSVSGCREPDLRGSFGRAAWPLAVRVNAVAVARRARVEPRGPEHAEPAREVEQAGDRLVDRHLARTGRDAAHARAAVLRHGADSALRHSADLDSVLAGDDVDAAHHRGRA